ncbi:hypothetical protein BC828DRAFT_383894 [Blastocladiella britannica]|nr:hypothetical protein BC828DRAFT_383894 [Blastocladiella britannica]
MPPLPPEAGSMAGTMHRSSGDAGSAALVQNAGAALAAKLSKFFSRPMSFWATATPCLAMPSALALATIWSASVYRAHGSAAPKSVPMNAPPKSANLPSCVTPGSPPSLPISCSTAGFCCPKRRLWRSAGLATTRVAHTARIVNRRERAILDRKCMVGGLDFAEAPGYLCLVKKYGVEIPCERADQGQGSTLYARNPCVCIEGRLACGEP